MNTAVINIKTDPKMKIEAQKVASDLGLSLSTIINGYLKEFTQKKEVTFSAVSKKGLKNKKTKTPYGIFSGADISEEDIDEIAKVLDEVSESAL